MKSETKEKATLYLRRRPLRVLAIPPTTAGINGALRVFADLLEEAGVWASKAIKPDEWEYLRLALSETAWPANHDEMTPGEEVFLACERGGITGGIPEVVWSEEPSKHWKFLCNKLREITNIQGAAILAGCRYAAHCGEPVKEAGAWWEVVLRVVSPLLPKEKAR